MKPVVPEARQGVEFKLLCACLQAQAGRAVGAAIAGQWQEANELSFFELAVERHRVGPLVHDALSTNPHWPATPELRARLASVARQNALQTLRGERHLALLSDWFTQKQIPWFAFKGIAVARRYYANPGLRHWNDTDIWIHSSRLPAVRRLLADKGYVCDSGAAAWDVSARGPRHRMFVESYLMEELHIHREYGSIDLHWALTDNTAAFRLTPESMLARAIPFTTAGKHLLTLSDMDHLLYLCEHGSRHHWARLKWLADLPRVFDYVQWDWAEVSQKAAQARATAALVQAMRLSQDLLGWQPPQDARPLMAVRHYRHGQERTAAIAMHAPLGWTIPGPGPLGWRLRASWARIFCPPNWLAARKLLRVLSLSPGDLRVVALPDRLFVIYRLLRPLLFLIRRVQAFAAARQ